MSTSKRTVTLKITTQKNLITFESSARTFGELKAERPDIKWDGMRVVERVTKNTLQVDDAILPATEFLLFVVPEKVKSGAESTFDVDKASYNELRSHISFLNKMKDAGLSLDGKIDELRATLNKYYKKAGKTVPEGIEALVDKIEESRVSINTAVDSLIEAVKNGDVSAVDTTEYVIKTSVDDLEKELNEIKTSLKL